MFRCAEVIIYKQKHTRGTKYYRLFSRLATRADTYFLWRKPSPKLNTSTTQAGRGNNLPNLPEPQNQAGFTFHETTSIKSPSKIKGPLIEFRPIIESHALTSENINESIIIA